MRASFYIFNPVTAMPCPINYVFRFTLLLLLLPVLLQAAEPNLLLITIDTLRADHLGIYGNTTVSTPNLDRLAQQSLFFENAFCVAPLTLPSHTSILTGRYPHRHGTRDNAGTVRKEETTLAEILGSRGYHTYAFVGGFPLEHRFGLNQGFDVYDDSFPRDQNRTLDFGTERNAEAVVEAFSKTALKQPFFVWIHFYDPHAPYLNGGYAGEVKYVDNQVGRLMQKFDRSNLLIAVAGDHGEGLGEHSEETHRIFIYDSTMRVPFWISGPDVSAKKIAEQVSLVDFVPTILGIMKIPAPKNLDGAMLPENAGKTLFMESMFPQLQLGWSPLRAVRTPQWKLIESPSSELYDLKKDRAELKNLYSSKPEVVKNLRGMLPKESAPPEPEAISPETAEQLAALGYIGGSTASNENLPDPKHRIDVWNQIELAADLQKDQPAKATALLEAARKSDPANPMVLSFLADLYMDQKKFSEARIALEQILKRDASNPAALLRIARLSLRQNKPLETLKWAEMLRKGGDVNAELQLLLANANLKLGRNEAAANHLLKAVQADPGDYATRIDLGHLYLQLKKPEDARKQFESVTKEDPNNVQALNGMATIAFELKEMQKSERYLIQANRIQPDDPQTKMNLALVYTATARTAQAIQLYRDVEKNPQTPPEWRNLAASRLKELQQ